MSTGEQEPPKVFRIAAKDGEWQVHTAASPDTHTEYTFTVAPFFGGRTRDRVPTLEIHDEARAMVAESKLHDLAEAVHRLNNDWANEDCGDPKCPDGECKYVQTVKRILDETLGTSYRSEGS